MKYIIHDEFGGVPQGRQYEILDTPATEKEWRSLMAAFAEEFSEFTDKEPRDYEFPEWHHGMRVLWAYLYNEGFYNGDFIPKVQSILKKQKNPCFAEFECFDIDKSLTGHFMVFKDSVIFSRLAEETGLLSKLIPKQQ